MNIYAYTRYSSSQQTESSTQRQVELARSYCEANNLTLARVFSDEAISGSRTEFDERPALQQLLSVVQSNDVVLVEQVDRLSRRHYKETLSLIWKLEAMGVTLYSTSQNRKITDDDISDTIMSLIDADKAHQYSKQLAERSQRGKLLARKRQIEGVAGQTLSAQTPTWIRRTDDKLHYELIPDRADTVRYMVELAAFMGTSAIATKLIDENIPCWMKTKYLNEDGTPRWTKSHVKTVVRNPCLSGDAEIKGIGVVEDYFPAVISKEEHTLLKRALSSRVVSRSKSKGGKTLRNLFNGIGRCGNVVNGVVCNHAMWIKNCGKRKDGSSRVYLYCADGCSKQMQYEPIEQSFLRYCREIDWSIFSGDKVDTKRFELRIAELDVVKVDIQGQIDNLVNVIAKTGNEALIDKLESLQKQLPLVQADIKEQRLMLQAEIYRANKSKTSDIGKHAELVKQGDVVSRMKLNQSLRDNLDFLKFTLDNKPRPNIHLKAGGRTQVIFFKDDGGYEIGYDPRDGSEVYYVGDDEGM
ncbi:recombinase family protein [Vibrio mediterranei]|uniref:recombinase family protein n=1 Tax=Vibrio mediterranei TaxID=689 RepID=UPI002283A9E2|nr:recombinase family protein [Vibrio mediterranei]MCY9855906.1 recombinase family protein [Vibrio mediterranei]